MEESIIYFIKKFYFRKGADFTTNIVHTLYATVLTNNEQNAAIIHII